MNPEDDSRPNVRVGLATIAFLHPIAPSFLISPARSALDCAGLVTALTSQRAGVCVSQPCTRFHRRTSAITVAVARPQSGIVHDSSRIVGDW